MEVLFREDDGINETECLIMYDGDVKLYMLVLKTFLKEIRKTKEAMQLTFDSEDIENYRILVHGLKGSGGSAGATALVDLATKSNDLIKNGRWEESKRFHQPLIDELTRLIDLIPERLRKKGENLV